jgi:hypothetical protein
MICSNCYKANYQNVTLEKVIEFKGIKKTIKVVGKKCPACGDIVFTQEQSKVIDKERKAMKERKWAIGDKIKDEDGSKGVVGIKWDDGDFYTIENGAAHPNPKLVEEDK